MHFQSFLPWINLAYHNYRNPLDVLLFSATEVACNDEAVRCSGCWDRKKGRLGRRGAFSEMPTLFACRHKHSSCFWSPGCAFHSQEKIWLNCISLVDSGDSGISPHSSRRLGVSGCWAGCPEHPPVSPVILFALFEKLISCDFCCSEIIALSISPGVCCHPNAIAGILFPVRILAHVLLSFFSRSTGETPPLQATPSSSSSFTRRLSFGKSKKSVTKQLQQLQLQQQQQQQLLPYGSRSPPNSPGMHSQASFWFAVQFLFCGATFASKNFLTFLPPVWFFFLLWVDLYCICAGLFVHLY